MDNPQLHDDRGALVTQTWVEKLLSNDPSMVKEAADNLNDFTRMWVREKGIVRERVLPAITVRAEDLDRDLDDRLRVIVERESESPAAVTVPFDTLPSAGFYIRPSRYPVYFSRIQGPRFVVDVERLLTYRLDIRDILTNNAVKDILKKEDDRFFNVVNKILVAADTVLPYTGVAQWQTINGGITRDSLWDMMAILPSTPNALEPAIAVTNHITWKSIGKFGRDEFGGDAAQDVMKNGLAFEQLLGIPWVVTIKKDVVETNAVYMFAEPKFLGKFLILTDTTLYIKREAFMLEFYPYETVGCTIGNTAAVAKATFA